MKDDGSRGSEEICIVGVREFRTTTLRILLLTIGVSRRLGASSLF